MRILSLALNLPGPAAMMRLRQMGATCLKFEPPSGDPMGLYNPAAYAEMHAGVKVTTADLKTEAGQKALHKELARTDVLLTSFRPSALKKLQLGWSRLHRLHPALNHVAIIGAPGARAEEPGHDLTYLAQHGLVDGLALPASLYADMGGSLMASEAALQAVVRQRGLPAKKGIQIEVALSETAGYLALPRRWGLTQPAGAVGGAHAGYRVYACKDGRVAVAALEPHFARALCEAASVAETGMAAMFKASTHERVAAFLASKTRHELDALAAERDIPMHTLAA